MVGIDRVMSEGRALTNAIGNSVATMVIAKPQGERDYERFLAVLDNPRLADADTEHATVPTDLQESPALPAPDHRNENPVRSARHEVP